MFKPFDFMQGLFCLLSWEVPGVSTALHGSRLKSVNCHHGGYNIDIIPSMSEILPKKEYQHIRHTKCPHIDLILHRMVSVQVGLFVHAIYS